MAQENYAIQLKGITKTFGSVVANNNIDLELKKGEILALLGENGSGKTTLMNMLSGIYRPDKGQIFIDGKKVYIDSPEDSKRLGIGMIHQHYKLIEKFSVADNIWLGYHQPDEKPLSEKSDNEESLDSENDVQMTSANKSDNKFENNFEVNSSESIDKKEKSNNFKNCLDKTKRFFKIVGNKIYNLSKKVFLTNSRYKKIEDFAKEYGFDIDPKKRICDMAVSEKQTVEIVKVLFYGAKVLILDEPTAVLTEQEIQKLFAILRNMKEKGCSIIIITHKLNEVMSISDRVSILRKGEYIGTVETAKTNEAELTEMMVGKKVDLHIDRPITHFDEDMLVVDNIVVNNSNNIKAIDKVSFKVRRGEILGVAGISGSGQKELCEAIAGLEKIKSGSITFMGQTISGKSPLDIINLGITMSFIPEDRLGMGLAGTLNITDNMMLKTYRNNKFNPFVDRKKAGEMAKGVVEKLDVQTPDTDKTPVRRLSGGNVQKVLLGREIEMTPQVIVTAYPVRGLDINSSYLIYDILNKQKQDGVGILFVGEDLDVMLQLCDKIMVLCHGKVTGIVDASMATKERLGLMMTGMFASEAFKDKPEAVIEDGQLGEDNKEIVDTKVQSQNILDNESSEDIKDNQNISKDSIGKTENTEVSQKEKDMSEEVNDSQNEKKENLSDNAQKEEQAEKEISQKSSIRSTSQKKTSTKTTSSKKPVASKSSSASKNTGSSKSTSTKTASAKSEAAKKSSSKSTSSTSKKPAQSKAKSTSSSTKKTIKDNTLTKEANND